MINDEHLVVEAAIGGAGQALVVGVIRLLILLIAELLFTEGLVTGVGVWIRTFLTGVLGLFEVAGVGEAAQADLNFWYGGDGRAILCMKNATFFIVQAL